MSMDKAVKGVLKRRRRGQ